MNNNKQSSVDWYINNLIEILGDEICNKLTIEQTNRIHFLGKQAKAMHKEESVDFALYAMMAESFNDLPEATKKQLREAIEVKYKEFFKL